MLQVAEQNWVFTYSSGRANSSFRIEDIVNFNYVHLNPGEGTVAFAIFTDTLSSGQQLRISCTAESGMNEFDLASTSGFYTSKASFQVVCTITPIKSGL